MKPNWTVHMHVFEAGYRAVPRAVAVRGDPTNSPLTDFLTVVGAEAT
jgi:hypothetical protein